MFIMKKFLEVKLFCLAQNLLFAADISIQQEEDRNHIGWNQKRIRDEDYDLLCYNELKLKRKERNQMEDKKNAVIVVDFGQNTFGGYFIKYSDGSIRSLCKEQLIEILNNKREAIPRW